MDTIIYYGEIYLKYIEATNTGVTEEDIQNVIKKLDGKGAITMSILQKREEIGRQEGIREGRQEGIREGIREGRQEGIREGLEHVAKNLLEEGMEIALVIKTTGLSKSQVEKLKKN